MIPLDFFKYLYYRQVGYGVYILTGFSHHQETGPVLEKVYAVYNFNLQDLYSEMSHIVMGEALSTS